MATGNYTQGYPTYLKLQSSTTSGGPWHDVWSVAYTPLAAQTITIPNYSMDVGGNMYFQFAFVGDAYALDYWYFDNLTVDGVTITPVASTATVNGILDISAGAYAIGNTNTLSLNGSLSGSNAITGGVTANLIVDGTGANLILPAITNGLNNLTINRANGATLKSALTVNGTLTNNAGNSGLVVSSDLSGTGSLIFNTTGVAGTVQRYIASWGDATQGWHLLASPVAAQAFQPAFVVPSSNEDFYLWDETQALWINSKNELTGPPWTFNTAAFGANFIPGKGYLVAYAAGGAKNFTGTMNVTDVNVSGLTCTLTAPYSGDITPGWNLLGNPFTSPITWNTAGWSLSNISAGAKIWNDATVSYTDIAASGIIPATQGFMVEVAPSTTGSLVIPAAARTNNAQAWYKLSGNPYIKLIAHDLGSNAAQESVVTFDIQTGPGYDPAFDSHFFPGYAPLFYSVDGTEHLSTNVLPGMDNQTTIPFNFVKTTGSDYSIEAAKIENVPAQVYLTDLKINKTQNLVENPVYTFTAVSGDDPARFLLSFSHVGISENSVSTNGIYAYGNNLYIVNPGKARLEVFSLTGQKLLAEEIDSPGLYRTSLSVPTGYYVMRLTTGTKVVVTKVFIKS